MRRDVSQQEEPEGADESLRALVLLLARAAAREVLAATPEAEDARLASLRDEGGEHAR